MEELIKVQRSKHDAHDLLLGILYYFPDEAKWDELGFHEALKKHYDDSIIKLEFGKIDDNVYSQEAGKIFDLLELSGIISRKKDKTRIELKLLKGHFDEEIRPTFSEKDIEKIDKISKNIQEELMIG